LLHSSYARSRAGPEIARTTTGTMRDAVIVCWFCTFANVIEQIGTILINQIVA
jgi:hypothetical protein